SDQYSLAIMYQELLTGTLPFPGKNVRQLMIEHLTQEPDVSPVPPADQPVLRRALAKSASHRFPSCTDFIHALVSRQTEVVSATQSGAGPTREDTAGADGVTHFRFGSILPPAVVRHRLEGFCREWHGTPVASDDAGLVLQLEAPRSAWKAWPARMPTLRVRLTVAPVYGQSATGLTEGSEVRMEVSQPDPGAAAPPDLFAAVGPLLAESVRMHMHVTPSRRTQVRLNWLHPVRVAPLLGDGSAGPEVVCQGKDLSLGGIGFYVEKATPVPRDLLLRLPATAVTAEMTVRARVVRITPRGGWFEVGAVPWPPPDAPPAARVPAVRPWLVRTAGLVALTAVLGFGLGVGLRVGYPEPPPAAPLPPAAGMTVAGREFADPQSAVEAAPDGAVIDVRGAVGCRYLRVAGKGLTFRGVPGTGAAIERQADADAAWEPLLCSDRALTVEGVDLTGSPRDVAPLACVEGATLALRGCTLTMPGTGPGLTLRHGQNLTLERCDLTAAGQGLAVEVKGRPCRVDVRDSRVEVRGDTGLFLLAWCAAPGPPAALDVTLTGSAVSAGRGFGFRSAAGPVAVTVRGGRLSLRHARLSFAGYRGVAEQPAVTWRDAGP
ncbi:MAG: PilZ domain-containing protein, partial [Gemmataceae bacterium]